MRKVFPVVVVLLALAAACGDTKEAEVNAGLSGEPPVIETVEATTTIPEETTTSLPEEVVEIPDTSDTGLTWDEIGTPNEVTGEVNVAAFNELLIGADDLNAMVPKESLEDLVDDELEAAFDEARFLAPQKAAAVYLGLEPDEADTQMLVAQAGGPEAWRVIVIQTLEDDSVRAVRWEFTIQMESRASLAAADTETAQAEEGLDGDAEQASTGQDQSQETPEGVVEEENTEGTAAALTDTTPLVYSLYQTTQCQPDRGHQDFATGLCV